MTNLHRVLWYQGTVFYTSTGYSHTAMYPFTQGQANEVGAILETDGIPIQAAIKLCEMWTKRGQHEGIRYSYRIHFVPSQK